MIIRYPTVSHLWQQSVCRLKFMSSQVSASESSPQQCPCRMANGLRKAAGLKHLTPQLACKWQGWVLARDWMCSPHFLAGGRAGCQHSARRLPKAAQYQFTRTVLLAVPAYAIALIQIPAPESSWRVLSSRTKGISTDSERRWRDNQLICPSNRCSTKNKQFNFCRNTYWEDERWRSDLITGWVSAVQENTWHQSTVQDRRG